MQTTMQTYRPQLSGDPKAQIYRFRFDLVHSHQAREVPHPYSPLGRMLAGRVDGYNQCLHISIPAIERAMLADLRRWFTNRYVSVPAEAPMVRTMADYARIAPVGDSWDDSVESPIAAVAV